MAKSGYISQHHGNKSLNPVTDARQTLLNAALHILRPLVRVLLRNGVTYRDFTDLAKWVFADVARTDFTLPGRKQTASRISVITGLTRKDVARLMAMPRPDTSVQQRQYHRAARVISGWKRDGRFTDDTGRPRALAFDGGGEDDFPALIRHYSGDMPARAVLDELQRVGAVSRREDGSVELLADAYVPHGDETQHLYIMGRDTALLLETIDHNLLARDKDQRRYQRQVLYDNLPVEALPALRRLGAKQAQALLEQLDEQFAAEDRDTNPDAAGNGRMIAGLGIYYFEKPWSEDES